MRLLRIPAPFDHPDFLHELKYDGFRCLAYVDGDRCELVSRSGHLFKAWPSLARSIADAVRARSAVLDGELVCLEDDGQPNFYRLLFRRTQPCFLAFDVLSVNDRDPRARPLLDRKRRLARLLPARGRVARVDYMRGRGVELFQAACERPRGHRREVGARHLSERHGNVLAQGEEPGVQPAGGATRAIRPPQ